MEDNKSRQTDEVEALHAVYGESSVLVDGETWTIPIHHHDKINLILEVPEDYPSRRAPTPRIHGLKNPQQRATLEAELVGMYQEDVEVAIMWAEYLRDILPDDECNDRICDESSLTKESTENTGTADQSTSRTKIIYACISTNHLFNHKPDSMLATGRKYQMAGYYSFGTPGIALCWCHDRIYLENFLGAMKSSMPQKKFEIMFESEWPGDDIPVSGWNECTTPGDLQAGMESCGCPSEDFYTVLGLYPSTCKGAANTGGKSSKGKGKSGKKKR